MSRLHDRCDVPEPEAFGGVGSVEMGDHVGSRHDPAYVEVLRRAVRPGGACSSG